ncbi:glutamate racemase [Hyphomonas sp.]|uniref:glutamate racemase n=1 Tax=Hyphomonas sp. TaxID=87 RepID=UPI000C42478C|nr:glutamate racemase [Hyphomonas sp.]MAU66045.1 glutamate racemase [Hyphomonas sp.]MBM56488.1 glutamate racemase [Hyphomonas sp.]
MVEMLPGNFVPSPARGRVLVFDSGVGGLTVAEEIRALGPVLGVHYAADSGFFPYGDKSDEALRERLPKVAKALCDRVRPDVFVIACNTASTLALQDVRAALDIPVVGTVPAIKPAAQLTRTGTIGLLATPGTIRRAYTSELIEKFAGHLRVIMHGSIELVRLAEAHARGEDIHIDRFAEAQAPLFDVPGGEKIDTIVLACTHFPLVRGQLIASAPQPVSYVDSGAAIARQTIRVLPVETEARGIGGHAYLTSHPEDEADLALVLRRYGFPELQSVALDPMDTTSAPTDP